MHRPPVPLPSLLSRRAVVAGVIAFAAASLAGYRTTAQTPPPGRGDDLVTRLGAMMTSVPARDLTGAAPIPFYYADLAGQLASLGIERPHRDVVPGDLPEGFFEGTIALPLAARAFQSGFVPEWFETFGFSPLAIGQALEIANAPEIISLFTDGFEPDRVETALEASGYVPVLQEAGGMYWTIGDALDLSSPVGRLGVGAMNHAVVDEDVLIFTGREADIQRVTHTRAGLEPSMLERGLWTGLMSVFSPDVVGLIPLSPDAVLAPAGLATPVAEYPHAGAIEYLAFGVRSGARSAPISLVGEGTPEATPAEAAAAVPAQVQVRIRYADPALAQTEVGEIPRRWASASSVLTGQAYTDLMTLEDARLSPDDGLVIALDFSTRVPNVWARMVHTLDLLPFLPAEG
jgi:hypothetical protein